MSFDKIKVMKEAERFLSQGKIRAAITEYKRIVEKDPRDFSTLNILGDLYIKDSEKKEAVNCFTKVAEHYNTQGFSQKAIAVYNKIARMEPDSPEVLAKLAQLYYQRGSVAEARSHYESLAEQFQRKGQKTEAIKIWKKIAEIDSKNTEIYLKIGEAFTQENQKDEAASAFIEAGLRLSEHEKYEAALAAFSKALELKKNDLRALNGLVKAQIGFGNADEAAAKLENILEEQPYNRDILYLLVDCYLDLKNPAKAERAVIKLVEQEPANYPKFLDLVKIYLKNHDLEAATRVLSMSSEHLLVGGQAKEFLMWTNEILARNPEQINAQRLLVRYYGWHRDESEFKQALERLAEIARLNEAVEDERYALSQLVMIVPHEISYARRLQEIKTDYGFGDGEFENKKSDSTEFTAAESFAAAENGHGAYASTNEVTGSYDEFSFAEMNDFSSFETGNSNQNSFSDELKEFVFGDNSFETDKIESGAENESSVFQSTGVVIADKFKLADEFKLQREIESVEFYITQGYRDLALKALDALEQEFGNRKELTELRLRLNDFQETDFPELQTKSEEIPAALSEEPSVETSKTAADVKKFEILNELVNDFDLEEEKADTESDYETHYQIAIAYKEMGLMEEAIREFQDAVNLVKPNDGTRRFFQCANLLGHCFMEKRMPNLALMWYKRGLEVANLEEEEKQAIYYEIGNAYEVGGDSEKAVSYFEQLYAENVDYRDVSERLVYLQENMTTA